VVINARDIKKLKLPTLNNFLVKRNFRELIEKS
jgi:hypothetical protein